MTEKHACLDTLHFVTPWIQSKQLPFVATGSQFNPEKLGGSFSGLIGPIRCKIQTGIIYFKKQSNLVFGELGDPGRLFNSLKEVIVPERLTR